MSDNRQNDEGARYFTTEAPSPLRPWLYPGGRTPNGPVRFVIYDEAPFDPVRKVELAGYVEYAKPLTREQCDAYGLIPDPDGSITRRIEAEPLRRIDPLRKLPVTGERKRNGTEVSI